MEYKFYMLVLLIALLLLGNIKISYEKPAIGLIALSDIYKLLKKFQKLMSSSKLTITFLLIIIGMSIYILYPKIYPTEAVVATKEIIQNLNKVNSLLPEQVRTIDSFKTFPTKGILPIKDKEMLNTDSSNNLVTFN